MGGRVLLDNVWVQGQMFTTGTSHDDINPKLSALIGDHLWGDPGQRPNLDSSGNPLSGLLDNVFVDGTLYQKGAIPPPEIAEKIGPHLWVGGLRPTSPDVAAPASGEVGAAPEGTLVGELDDEHVDDEHDDDEHDDGRDGEGGDLEDDESSSEHDDDESEPGAFPPEPARAGRGAKRELWVQYATALGLSVSDDDSRDDIIAAVDARRGEQD